MQRGVGGEDIKIWKKPSVWREGSVDKGTCSVGDPGDLGIHTAALKQL